MAVPCDQLMERPHKSSTMEPSKARSLIRTNGYTGFTSGFCSGYAQFNIIILCTDLADDFEKFCLQNAGALPLLYRSKVGETAAPSLAKDSNIRSDLPCYVIYKNGVAMQEAPDLSHFTHIWSHMVSFYIGCSSTFDWALLDSEIEIPNLLDVPCFKSNIPCCSVGPFAGIGMYVSMRPIRPDQLRKTFVISSQYPDYHGAPIHIGDPAHIGLSGVSVPEGFVPVFWACGFTVQDAISRAEPELSFSHYPGAMFISDVKVKPVSLEDSVEIVQLSKTGREFYASVINNKAISKLETFKEVISLSCEGEGVDCSLLRAVLSLSHAQQVVIISSSSVHTSNDCLLEVLGMMTVCQALLHLNKEVTLITSKESQPLFDACIEHIVDTGAHNHTLPTVLVDVDGSTQLTDCKCVLLTQTSQSKVPCKLEGPVVITLATELNRATNNDYTICSKSLDIGGYALAYGLLIASTSPSHWRYKNKAITSQLNTDGFLPSAAQMSHWWELLTRPALKSATILPPILCTEFYTKS